MAARHRGRVSFLAVYVKEAHPEDGWVLSENRDAEIAVVDPVGDEERESAAAACAVALRLNMPMAIDAVDNEVARAYGGWPDRLYLVGADGRIAYRGGEGPFGFKPDELEAAIERELALRSPPAA
jgi:iodothyronine deiodinase-like protein